MALFTIPTRLDLAAYRIRIPLSGKPYLFQFVFNETASRWVMTILDLDGTVLIAGIPLVLGQLLHFRFANENLPIGNLFLYDTSGEGKEPGFGELGPEEEGGRVQLLYDDLEEAA